MLEWQWLACRDPVEMLRFLAARPADGRDDCGRGLGRKLRLFTFACCRRVRHLTDRPVQKALAVFERLLDEPVPDDVLRRARKLVRKEARDTDESPGGEYPAVRAINCAESVGPFDDVLLSAVYAAQEARTAVGSAATGEHTRPGDPLSPAGLVAVESERAYQVAVVHDVVGNPFQPVALDPAWRTSTVTALARGIYQDAAFDRLPILADALQDAGCGDETVLNHCSSDGPHARGCWVVDLLLGKA